VDCFWKLLTVLVASFAAYVAYQQYRVGREKLKLDLFEKRFSVFSATRHILSRISSEGSMPPEVVFKFRTAVSEASFLFDSDISNYLNEIDKCALRLWVIDEKLKTNPLEIERNLLLDEKTEKITWVMNQVTVLASKFGIYLKFHIWH
jgi:hypothetical protein